ncbi:site-specific integrase [Atopococcus tabaci]|uniref:site-specific integrase n=1 Tax=Atopococcus tabaci TaxID=269774 RepID=UPI0004159145|nr:site-specific integrase [Atopococcus tabaci]
MATFTKYTKKDGSTAYKVQGYLGTDSMTGKRARITRQGFKTKREAELAFSRLKVEFSEGKYQQPTYETFEEIAEVWLETIYKNSVKESSYAKVQSLFRLYILPAFGHLRVERIHKAYCQQTVEKWSEEYKSFSTIKNYASQVLDYAVYLDIIHDNPMKKILMPKKKKQTVLEGETEEKLENFYTKDELQRFLESTQKERNPLWPVLFRVLAFTGCRKGEVLSLEWRDIDFEQGTLSINKTLSVGEDAKLIIQAPKTEASIRKISLDDITLQILRDWKSQQAKDYLKLGFNTLQPNQLVFPNQYNRYIQPTLVNYRMNRAIERAGLREVTVHGLRHTHCSLLFESGSVSFEEVKERLGHSDIQTTLNIYTHVTQQTKEETAKKFASYMVLIFKNVS